MDLIREEAVMKIRNILRIIFMGGLVLTIMSGCSQEQEAEPKIPDNPKGIYTNIQDFEDVSSRLVGTHAMKGDNETVGQISSLTVYETSKAIQLDENNNAIKDKNNEIVHVDNDNEDQKFYKYVFVKNSIVGGLDFLVYNRGQYTGYCTYDKETGELLMYIPEYYMTYTTNQKELTDWPETVTNTKVTDEVLNNPTSGLSFASEWQAHGGNTIAVPFRVVLNDDKEFEYISAYDSEDSAEGNNYDYQFEDYSYLYNADEEEGE